MAPTEVIRSHRLDSNNVNGGESQPHLRWQVLVIFTIFVTMIRFYVLGNKSEILIYCVCGLILLMAALLLSLCSLRKGINSSSPNRFNNISQQRNNSLNSSIGSRRRSRSNNYYHNHHQQQQQQYQLETIINHNGNDDDHQRLNETLIRGGFISNDYIDCGFSINNNNINYNHHSNSLEQLQYENNLLLAGANANNGSPPPYQIAILLPETSNNIMLINKDYDENTPPPSYDKIINIS